MALEDCVATLPAKDVQAEASRRMLTDALVVQVSRYLAAPVWVGVTLSPADGQPPLHWRGFGPLDCVLGIQALHSGLPANDSSNGSGEPVQQTAMPVVPASAGTPTVILTYPKDAHVARVQQEGAVLEEEEDEYSSSDSDSDSYYLKDPEPVLKKPMLVHASDGGPLSAVMFKPVLPYNTKRTVKGAGVAISAVALRQLSAQCHDLSYVSHQDLQNGVQHRATQPTKFLDRWRVWKTKRAASPILAEPCPVRAHRKVMGVLTTADSWQVYRYSLPEGESQDPGAKQRLEMVGQFRMPLLVPVNNSCNISEGATALPNSAVDAEAVERVMAMLVLAAQGQL